MPKENDPDKEMENLSKAIVEAILASDDVKSALEKLNESPEAVGKNFMVFMVSLDSLNGFKAGRKDIDFEGLSEEMPKPKRRRPGRKPMMPDLIDGKPVSENEKRFQDMMSDQFDSDEWLKKLRLRLE